MKAIPLLSCAADEAFQSPDEAFGSDVEPRIRISCRVGFLISVNISLLSKLLPFGKSDVTKLVMPSQLDPKIKLTQ